MEIEKKKEGRDFKKLADDVIDIVSDSVALVGSPTALWLMALWNSSGGKGFSGFVSNPRYALPLPAGSKVPSGENTPQQTYGQWTIYLVTERMPPNLWYAQNTVSGRIVGPFQTDADARKWIDQNG
jgi:hypothetical protein